MPRGYRSIVLACVGLALCGNVPEKSGDAKEAKAAQAVKQGAHTTPTPVKSNENAQEALAHTKKMAAVELRPYVHIDEIGYSDGDPIERRGSITIRIKNFGSTPATRFRVEAGADLRNTRNLSPGSSLSIRQRRYPTVDELPPGHTATIVLPAPPSGAFHRNDNARFCSVQFWYSDKFGDEYMRWETYKADKTFYREGPFSFFSHNQGPAEA